MPTTSTDHLSRITDVCLIPDDLDLAIAFYRDVLGYQVSHRMPGFVDFTGPGPVLALWEAEHLSANTGVPATAGRAAGPAVMLAIELDSPDEVDVAHGRLTSRGVEFYREPADYPWNARCAYFAGPCGELWELYAWYDGGEPGAVTGAPTSAPAASIQADDHR
jgi:catechol 2,3-dioxygenase-like lactoylglutathione lyase family enzyme